MVKVNRSHTGTRAPKHWIGNRVKRINLIVKPPHPPKITLHMNRPSVLRDHSVGFRPSLFAGQERSVSRELPDVHSGVRLPSFPEAHPGRRLPSVDSVEDVEKFLISIRHNFSSPNLIGQVPPTLSDPPHPGVLFTLGQETEAHPGRRLPSVDSVEDVEKFLGCMKHNLSSPNLTGQVPSTLPDPPHPGVLITLGQGPKHPPQDAGFLSPCSCMDDGRNGVCWQCQEEDFRTDPRVCEELYLYDITHSDPYPEHWVHQWQSPARELQTTVSPKTRLPQAPEPLSPCVCRSYWMDGEWSKGVCWQCIEDSEPDPRVCAQLARYRITYRARNLAQTDPPSPRTFGNGKKSRLTFQPHSVDRPVRVLRELNGRTRNYFTGDNFSYNL